MMRAALRLAVQRCGLSASVSMSIAGGVVVALGLLMAGTSMLKVNGDKGEWVATPQKLCDGSAAALCGVMCHPNMAVGTPSIAGSGDGGKPGSGRALP